jgi:hypothetical protein
MKVCRLIFAFQENFSAVPKRVWADVVRKLGINTNARNAAADLFVGSPSRTFLNLLTHFVSVSALLTFDLGA